jgi:hypothetical protein
MKWIAKALLQKVLSALPTGEQYNYWFQRKTGGLPVSDDEFIEKVRLAGERIERWEKFGKKPLAEIQCFEFGGGWDLIGPLSFWSMGVEHQTVIDIRPNVHLELVNDSIQKFLRLRAKSEAVSKRAMRSIPDVTIQSVADLESDFGIRYLAPLDAAETGLPANSIDFIATNSTLEHIDATTLPRIMRESRRILAEDGIEYHAIDMKDHFSYFDSSISKYNFLTLSDAAWSVLNSALSYQNRLRYADYQRIFREAGLHVIDEAIEPATSEDLETFRNLNLASGYANSDTEEHLAAHIIRVVLAKTAANE